MVKVIFIVLGFVFLGIGAIGVILPVLPTVPLFMLASFCFMRGSKRFHNWFLSTALYKSHLESFYKSRSMTLKTKASILGFASSMLIMAFIVSANIYARIFIGAAFIFKYYYFILKIKTIKVGCITDVRQETDKAVR